MNNRNWKRCLARSDMVSSSGWYTTPAEQNRRSIGKRLPFLPLPHHTYASHASGRDEDLGTHPDTHPTYDSVYGDATVRGPFPLFELDSVTYLHFTWVKTKKQSMPFTKMDAHEPRALTHFPFPFCNYYRSEKFSCRWIFYKASFKRDRHTHFKTTVTYSVFTLNRHILRI